MRHYDAIFVQMMYDFKHIATDNIDPCQTTNLIA